MDILEIPFNDTMMFLTADEYWTVSLSTKRSVQKENEVFPFLLQPITYIGLFFT